MPTHTRAFLLFHLNLGFSTLDVLDRPRIVERCYEPMLRLAEETGRPIGVEATAWTLTQLQRLAPQWLERLRGLVNSGAVEFIGSGWAQVIGPLAPAPVNVWNQRLGREAYADLLGIEPDIALVNEMAYSAGLVDVYAQAGYRALALDRENARAALGIEDRPAHVAPRSVVGPGGAVLPVVWSDTILFQRFQRVVHGEIGLDDYLAVLERRVADGQTVLPIYSNDVEVFGHRPGRFMIEAALKEGEWERIARILDAIDECLGVEWVRPIDSLAGSAAGPPDESTADVTGERGGVTSAHHPVLVKKQRKYNLNRWALSGRDDLRLNTMAHRIARAAADGDDAAKREACEWWASDLRTHLTDLRWEEVRERLDRIVVMTSPEYDGASAHVSVVDARDTGNSDPSSPVLLEGADVAVELDPRRGGTLRSIAFRSHGWVPCLGNVAQGTVPAIDVAADFYTGGVVVDLPGSSRRLTDLEPCRIATVRDDAGWVAGCEAGRWHDGRPLARTTVHVPSAGGEVRVRFDAGRIRPHGSVRVGHLTLLPDAFPESLWLEVALGGRMESFAIDEDVDHGSPVSMLVSSTTSLAGGGGELRIGDDSRAIRVSWDPSVCAAVPMLHHRKVGERHLTRLWFSLSELDDTFRDGGALLPFELRIEPAVRSTQ